MRKIYVSPSFLSANFNDLASDIDLINKSEADWFHLDIMDGVFVPNISFGFPIISHIKKLATKPLDVHLMIVQPDKYIEKFKKSGADILTVHYEACTHLHRTIQNIKSVGMKAGASLNPHTPVSVLEDIIEDLDLVLIMSVNPGYGGQKFIENSYKKIKQLRKMIDETNSKALIEVDGGVDFTNNKKLYQAGVDVLVAGSSVFKSNNPEEAIQNLKNI
ncbi:MAG: ribulose-phosphate 3-epimerase [Bacteroidales bacterium]|nr:ribulose-phosphate 3-epimerase [Bacteroidales bacterium]